MRGLASMLAGGEDSISVAPEVSVDTDVVVYDVLGLHEHGSHDLEHVLSHDQVTVLAIGRSLRPDLLTQALALGAHGFVDPDIDATGLRRAVLDAPHTVPTRREPRPGVAVMPSALDGRRLPERDVSLTDREVDVLTFITHGLSNREVAAKCFLSINSVKTYIRSAYRKIGAESRTQAVIWCLQHGFSPQVP